MGSTTLTVELNEFKPFFFPRLPNNSGELLKNFHDTIRFYRVADKCLQLKTKHLSRRDKAQNNLLQR